MVLSGSWRSSLYSSYVYSCHLLLISSASIRSIPFLSFIKPISAWNVSLLSLSFFTWSLVFPILLFSSIFFALITEESFLSLLAILWNSAFRCLYLSFSPLPFTSPLFSAICKASSDSHFTFLHFFYLAMGLIPVSCTRSRISVCSSSGTLSIKSSLKSICYFHCTIIRYLIYVIPEWSSGFPHFLQFKSEFGNKEFMIWATVSLVGDKLQINGH